MLTYVLFLFILRPDHAENLLKHSMAYLILFLVLLGSCGKSIRNRVISSAYVSFNFLFSLIVSYGVIFEFLRIRARISITQNKEVTSNGINLPTSS